MCKTSAYSGLNSENVKLRLARYGPNILPEKPPPSDLGILISQLKSPLVYILLFAGLITIFIGYLGDSLIILFAVLINTLLGYWQEHRANKALYVLSRLVVPQTTVIRDGFQITVPASSLVVGDVVILNPGQRVPADGEVFEAVSLFMNEAILTGESQPVNKEPTSEIFMGTTILSGRGKMIVSATGKDTKMGAIAQEVSGPLEETPLRKQLKSVARQLTFLVAFLVAFVFIFGFISGRPAFEMFLTSVALAVSAIPEGLLVSTTIVLVIGMMRILKHGGLVRRLLAAETLGGVTTICVDKTGTLTEGRMRVVKAIGDKPWLLSSALLCNNLYDPLEIGMMEWVEKHKTAKEIEGELKSHPRLDEIPFSQTHRYTANLHSGSRGNVVLVMGAPEIILAMCGGLDKNYTRWQKIIEQSGREGFRIVGFARKNIINSNEKLKQMLKSKNLEFSGLLLFDDPVRLGVAQALEKTKIAGVKVKIITGDYPATAQAVLAKLNMHVDDSQVILGEELKNMNVQTLLKKINDTVLFARTSPDQKLKIVQALKHKGEVVAMVGDGVNDAPALSKADIGIVVAGASDVSKETADLVLTDSNFSTIVSAIEDGRGIFDNLRKIVVYLLSDAFGEIVAVFGSLLLFFPLPLLPAQILWINIVSDGFPNLALTIDPKRKGMMKESPRSHNEQIITKPIAVLVAAVSIISGLIALSVFILFYRITQDLVLSRSVAFLTLGINSLLYVFSLRNLTEPVWKNGWLTNKWLLAAVAGGFILQALPFYIPFLQEFFGTTTLYLIHWGIGIGSGMLVVLFIEVAKITLKTKFEFRI